MWQRIIKFSIYALVFLVPLFWLPFSFEAFEFNKGYLLFILVSVGLIAWLGKMIFKDKEIRFRRTPLDFYVLGFLVVMVFSALLSQDKISSLLGFYGRFWPSLIGILSLGGFYFLITNNVTVNREQGTENNKKTVRCSLLTVHSLIKTFLWSAFFVVLISYFSLFGVWRALSAMSSKFNLPGIMTLRTFNPIGGSLEALAMFLAFISVLIIGLIAFHKLTRSRKFVARAGLYILLFAGLGLLALIDFWASWVVIFISLVFFLALSFWKRIFREDVGRLSLSILFLIISAFFLFSNPLQSAFQDNAVLGNLPQEVLPSQEVSWSIGWAGLKNHLVLGSGLGNFSYLFSRFKPEAFLATPLWQIRFDRASSHIAEILGTTGILGILSYGLLLGMFLMISWMIISTVKLSEVGSLQFPLLIGFVALLIGQFVFYQNMVLAFGFWLFLGLAVVSWQKPVKEKVFSFKDFPEVGLIFSVVFWLILFGFLFSYFNLAKLYLADVHYRGYLEDPSKIERMEKAAKLGEGRSTYHIVLARAYLGRFIVEAQKPQPDNQVVANMVALAVQEGKRAVEISPKRVAAQETLSAVYRDIQGMAQGALEWACTMFEKAIELEPKNPVLLTELGKLEVIRNELESAKELFTRALEMKPIYLDAALQLAIFDEREGNIEGAVRRLEDLVSKNPLSVEAHFQLGRLYYNAKEYNKAIGQFQSSLLLFPNHSNSLYSLGLIYERQGEKQEALQMFIRVLQLNPDNEDVKSKIEELKE